MTVIRRRIISITGTALALVFLGAAVAGALPLPKHKPVNDAAVAAEAAPAATSPVESASPPPAAAQTASGAPAGTVVIFDAPPEPKAAAVKVEKTKVAAQPHKAAVANIDLTFLPKHKPVPHKPALAKASGRTATRAAAKADVAQTAPRPSLQVIERAPAAAPLSARARAEADQLVKLMTAPIVAVTSPAPAKTASEKSEPERTVTAPPADQARLLTDVMQKKPSLLDRVFGPGDRLSDDDAARYAHIFAFQDTGDFIHANAEIEKLSDTRLMGHVLSQRYLSPDYHASYEELAGWMKAYADHPVAGRIYELAQHRKPRGAPSPSAPHNGRGVYALYDFDVGQLATPYMGEQRHTPRQRDIIRAVEDVVSESPTLAQKRLERQKKLFDDTEYDSLRASIAASYFYNDKVEKARELATSSAKRSGEDVPLAAWISGLAAWRQGDYASAAKYFETTADSDRTSAWMSAAGAHWAARAYLRSRQPQKVGYWLRRAAEYPRTFYGIISMKALGMEQAKFNWEVPELTGKHIKALSAVPAGRRALALVDAERPDLAELELGQVNPGDDIVLKEAMIALASRNGMPGLAMRMGSSFKGRDGRLYDAALYPNAPWEPERGFSVDKALVYAFIRQESQFQPAASNRYSGAVGLMQLMPGTAEHVARLYGAPLDHERLDDPMLNIDLGQKYLSELLKNEYVENNLFKLAVAYNAGPGKLARWEDKAGDDKDPLLFIESIPVAETRLFVERVLANYWIYRIKYHQDTASLDKVAEGDWPIYLAQDSRRGPVYAAAEEFLSR